jgi:hypothetical protein
LQAIPLAWGVWITTFDGPLGLILGAQLAASGFSLWRATRRVREEEDAIAGMAFVPLPVVGLLRAPHWGWVIAALVVYAVILRAFRVSPRFGARLRRGASLARDFAVVGTTWSICAILTTPYRFRDLPRLNHLSHEAGQYASINSIAHGRLMMADAGLIYGPLRSYALALYMYFAGMTAEQVRLGQALMTLGALGLMVWVGWRLVDRGGLAMGWFLYLLLAGTYVRDWVNYQAIIAFGWADLGRIGVPIFAAVGGVEAFLALARAGRIDRRGAGALAGWGAGATVATLWAQEFGACTILAFFAVAVLHLLLQRGSLRSRARLGATAIGVYGAGLAGAFVLYLGVYALYGRAGLFLRTVTAQSAAFTSGSYGALEFPVDESSFLTMRGLFASAPHEGTVIEYVIPPAIYLFTLVGLAARALGRRWKDGDSLTLAVLVFGVTSFRFALGRTDYLHMATADLPAAILVVRVAVESVRAIYVSRIATFALRLGALGTAVALVVWSLSLSGVTMALRPRLTAMLAGTERPSSGPAYVYPGIPRAGDVKIQPEYVALVEAIRERSSDSDKIFQHIAYMDGGEVYFLADRGNPTSYDVLAEFLTTDRQHTAFEQVARDPPKLEVGEDWGMTGPELNQYLKDHYHSLGDFSGFKLMGRNE